MSSLLSALLLCREPKCGVSMYAITVSTPSQRQANFPIIHFPFNYNSKAINVCGGATILYIRFESTLFWCIETIRSLEHSTTPSCAVIGVQIVSLSCLNVPIVRWFKIIRTRYKLRSRKSYKLGGTAPSPYGWWLTWRYISNQMDPEVKSGV